MHVRNPDIVSNEIIVLHDTQGLSYRQIAALPAWDGIPAGTLWAIAHGYPIPNCHRETLGLPPLVKVPANMVRKTTPSGKPDRRNRRAINLDDPASAARTIRRYADDDYIQRLVTLLGKE